MMAKLFPSLFKKHAAVANIAGRIASLTDDLLK
jgi:hypothetical protein